jgi:dUTP pyrophosphatase
MMEMVTVKVHRLTHAEGLPLPTYATTGAAGADLHSAEIADVVLRPQQRAAVATGLILELPPGYEGQVRPRSGLARRHGVTVVNAPGTIDSDYRGEVMVLLINLGDEAVTIRRGERIAQLVIAPVTRAELVEATELSDSERGSGGFGSTGQ